MMRNAGMKAKVTRSDQARVRPHMPAFEYRSTWHSKLPGAVEQAVG